MSGPRPLSFDEVRLWLTGERVRIETVGNALVEEGCALEFDPRRRREIEIIDALLGMVDERAVSKSGRGIGFIKRSWEPPQSGEGHGDARNDSAA